ncbi:MAG: lysophospholipid acyltransferase family protein [Brevirhabdus sp.]
MEDTRLKTQAEAGDDYKPYDKRRLSYAGTFTNPWKVNTIRTIEWLTGKITLLKLIRQYEREGVSSGRQFWADCLRIMGIDLLTPQVELDLIPKQGPVILVANHPRGLVDGLVIAELMSRVRDDYKILTRSLLTGIPEIEKYMLPVAFPHEPNAQRLNIDMRKKSMEQLANGGMVMLFPAGSVACSETWFGDAIEQEWNPFTAKMIKRSGATVVPVYFPGRNTRAYQIANRVSATVRQGLLLHEVVDALNTSQRPVVGEPISPEELAKWDSNPRGMMTWLREHTLEMKNRL